MTRARNALARWVSSSPRQALAVVGILTVIMGVCARDVRLDNNFAGLFNTSSADARFREQYRATFGADDGLLIAVIETEAANESSFALVDTISRRVARMGEVDRVDSVTTLDVVRPSADGTSADLGPAFAPATSGLPLPQRIKLARDSDLGTSNLISRDGRTLLVVGELRAEFDSYEKVTGPADEFERIVRSSTDGASGTRVHFAGVAFTRIAAISEMQGDLIKLFPLATAMMGLLLWWFFRRPVAVVGPMMAIVASTVCTAGVIGLAGDDINQITIIYPVLLMGVVVATATHLIHRFYLERAAGSDSTTAAQVTLERIARAAIVCTITNAIGFLSLLSARMSILHEFGVYLAAGVGFCFISTTLVVPALLVIRDSAPPAKYLEQFTAEQSIPGLVVHPPSLTRVFGRTVTRPAVATLVQVAGVGLVLASAVVASGAHYDYSLSAMLNTDRPTSVGNRVIDRQLSGIVPIEISVTGEPGAFSDPGTMERLSEFNDWLRDEHRLRTVGLPSVIDAAEQLNIGRPEISTAYEGLYAAVRTMGSSDPLGRIVTADLSQTRLRAFHPDTGSTAIVALTDKITAKGNQYFDKYGVTVRVTGEAPVAYRGMNDLTGELVMSTLIAVLLIVVAIGVAFRSAGLAAVVLLPNIAPVAVGFAIYTSIKDTIDPVPGVVFCIAMGLAADDTVHLINRFREIRPQFARSQDALTEALVYVRRAMVSSSIVLIASFLALGVSGFPTNRTLGLLGALVLLLALGSDLLFGTTALALLGASMDRYNSNIDGTPLDAAPDQPNAPFDPNAAISAADNPHSPART